MKPALSEKGSERPPVLGLACAGTLALIVFAGMMVGWWVVFTPGSNMFFGIMPGMIGMSIGFGVFFGHLGLVVAGPRINHILSVDEDTDRVTFSWRSDLPSSYLGAGLMIGSLAASLPAAGAGKFGLAPPDWRATMLLWAVLAPGLGAFMWWRRYRLHRAGLTAYTIDTRTGLFHIARIGKGCEVGLPTAVSIADIEGVCLASVVPGDRTQHVCVVLRSGATVSVRALGPFERERLAIASWLADQLDVDFQRPETRQQ